MLIDFTITNFRSIKLPVTLSVLATHIRDYPNNRFSAPGEKRIQLLKSAVIYGPNAAGKSNIIKALAAFREFILDSTDLKVDEEIQYYEPFRLDEETMNAPTQFDIEFMGNNKIRYKYEIAFDRHQILKENLTFYPKGKEATLFLRQKGQEIKFGDYFKGAAKTIEKQLLDNHLFLSKAANSKNPQMKEIYLYFRNNLKIDLRITAEVSPLFSDFTTQLCREDKEGIILKRITDLLRLADTGITSLELREKALSNLKIRFPDDMPSDLQHTIIENLKIAPKAIHPLFKASQAAGEIEFDLSDESIGTIKLYDLGGKILQVLREGWTYVIDELSNSLHPTLTEALINLFHDPEANPHNAQLIFATHDTSILNPATFRRDQIWFTAKDEYGATNLYALSEFDTKDVRANTPFEKWYLSGKFGALPQIGHLKNWITRAKETP